MSLAVVIAFFLLAFLGMPLAFALGLSALIGMYVGDLSWLQMAGKMVHSIDSFPLMAIPLFMIAGELMLKCEIMERLIDFANTIVGRVPGGLAHVTVVAATGLSAVSGTAVADASALGSTLGPPLSKAYSREFGASLVAASSNLGPIIPPSAAMIVYAVMAGNVSVGALFLSGVVPGLIISIAMMGYCSYVAYRRNYPLTGLPFSFRNLLRETKRSFIVFMMPIIVIGGIVGGVFTATEGAAIAVVYALFIGFFITRKLRFADLPGVLLNAAIITSVVGALIVYASIVTYLFTIEMLPHWLSETLEALTSDPFIFIVLVMIALVIVGMFIEANAAFVMLAPLFAPIVVAYGIDPLLFGFLFVMNIVIGGITPPVGILLFVVSGIWRMQMSTLIANIWPFILIQYAVLVLCLLFPPIVLTLPRAFGY